MYDHRAGSSELSLTAEVHPLIPTDYIITSLNWPQATVLSTSCQISFPANTVIGKENQSSHKVVMEDVNS